MADSRGGMLLVEAAARDPTGPQVAVSVTPSRTRRARESLSQTQPASVGKWLALAGRTSTLSKEVILGISLGRFCGVAAATGATVAMAWACAGNTNSSHARINSEIATLSFPRACGSASCRLPEGKKHQIEKKFARSTKGSNFQPTLVFICEKSFHNPGFFFNLIPEYIQSPCVVCSQKYQKQRNGGFKKRRFQCIPSFAKWVHQHTQDDLAFPATLPTAQDQA